MGCGSGRWAYFIAPLVKINCIEPSMEALNVAKIKLRMNNNCYFENNDVSNNTLKNNSQDFGYSYGCLTSYTKVSRRFIKLCKKT